MEAGVEGIGFAGPIAWLVGPWGLMGPWGRMGPWGPHGLMGPDGRLGPRGPMGPYGPTGPVGPLWTQGRDPKGPGAPRAHRAAGAHASPMGPHGTPWGPMGLSGIQSGSPNQFCRVRNSTHTFRTLPYVFILTTPPPWYPPTWLGTPAHGGRDEGAPTPTEGAGGHPDTHTPTAAGEQPVAV